MIEDRIRELLQDYGRLDQPPWDLDETDNLYAAGLTSHASVNVMLGLEDAFEMEFPERLLRKVTFSSISTIKAAIFEVRTDLSQ